MFEDSPYVVCPYGHDIGDDHDQHDDCNHCREDCYKACGAAFVPLCDKTPSDQAQLSSESR